MAVGTGIMFPAECSRQDIRTQSPRSPLTLRIVELLILAYTGVRILAVAFSPPFRSDLRSHPALGTGLVTVGALALGLTLAALWRWPALLHLYAGAAILALVGAWWRARPSYGEWRNWPPGSLGLGVSLAAIGDRDFYLRQAQVHGPVFKMSQFGRPVLCVVGLARGRDLLLRNGAAFASASLPYNRFVPKGSLRYMSASNHKTEAPVFRSALGNVDLACYEEAARHLCRGALAELSAASLSSSEGVPPREHLRRWVFLILAQVFFGIPADDPRLPALDEAQGALRLDRAGGRRWRAEMEAGFVEITQLMREQAAPARDDPDLMSSSALAEVLAVDPTLLESEARTRNLILIFRLAVGDVTGLLDWILSKISENPEWQDKVHATTRTEGRPSGAQPDDVGSRVVLETLRMEQSEYLYRRIVRPLEVDGFRVPSGWLLRVCVQESHRDPQIFPDPDRFDPDRFVGRPMSRREYSPFGADDRGCMGVPMVHFLGRVFVEELCHAYHCTVSHDAPMERGTRHRDHWRPSPTRRIQLAPRA